MVIFEQEPPCLQTPLKVYKKGGDTTCATGGRQHKAMKKLKRKTDECPRFRQMNVLVLLY